MAEQPNVYIVAGPNGAGKSTFARLFLPEYADCREFVNADLIAAGLSPFNPEGRAIQAGRLMLERVEALARTRVDFGFETTLAGRGYISLLRRLKDSGYRIHVFFLWLPSVEMALARVRDRVLAGGHSVPEEVVRRRFSRGLPTSSISTRRSSTRGWSSIMQRRSRIVAFCLEADRIALDARSSVGSRRRP